MSDRRQFLRSLVTLPLIGGGVTLIGAPSVPVPLLQAAAVPGIGDARQRARYGWEAFASAMDEVTASAAGWRVIGAGRIGPLSYYEGLDFLRVAEVSFELDRDPRLTRPLVIERHREVDIGKGVVEGWA